MKSALIAVLFLFSIQSIFAQQYGRLESEYKLAVPKSQKDALWSFMQDEFLLTEKEIAGFIVQSSLSEEKFIDQYFDTPTMILSQHKSGLRYRQRFVDDELVKELIQLKLPQDSSGITRTEIKFELKKKSSAKDTWARHPFLKYLRRSDQESLNYHLSHLLVKVDEMVPSIKLLQYRDRIYISDTLGSVATITLDRVNNLSFPFQGFVEMEIELNEIRYTDATDSEKLSMDKLRESLKNMMVSQFSELTVDQTPKYNKMEALIEGSFLDKAADNFMWGILAIIIFVAGYLKITE